LGLLQFLYSQWQNDQSTVRVSFDGGNDWEEGAEERTDSVRPVKKTFAPDEAKRMAVARPMPIIDTNINIESD
jgi:hypothetical protein